MPYHFSIWNTSSRNVPGRIFSSAWKPRCWGLLHFPFQVSTVHYPTSSTLQLQLVDSAFPHHHRQSFLPRGHCCYRFSQRLYSSSLMDHMTHLSCPWRIICSLTQACREAKAKTGHFGTPVEDFKVS